MAVCAVVVTHNRRALLVQCLAALESQTVAVEHVLVVDNASTDGTAALIAEEHPSVELLALSENAGGAGGFHAGMRHAHAAGFEWLWLMDDDTIPTQTALQELLEAAAAFGDQPPALLSSKVIWRDGRLHPMNLPGFERERIPLVVAAAQRRLLALRTATFVSLLVHRTTVDRHGLPLARYFIWSDDIEYTARVLRSEPGYLAPASVVEHRTREPYTAISTSGERFYFHVRNTLYTLRGPAWAPREKPAVLLLLGISVLAYGRHNAWAPRSGRVIARGLRDGLRPGAPVAGRP